MENWWEEAPIAQDENWWDTAPLADQPPATPATQNVGGMEVPSWMAQQTDAYLQQAAQSEADAAAMLNRAGESMTFGLVGDEAAAGFDTLIGRGEGYDERLNHYRQMENDLSGGQRLAADLGGAIIPGILGAGLVSGANSLAGAVGRSAAFGGAGGATHGFMEGEGINDRIDDAKLSGLLGVGVGAAVPLASAGVGRVVDSLIERSAVAKAVRNAPSTDDLRAAGSAAYREIDDAGVHIRADRMRDGLADIVAGMRNEGVGLAGADKVMPSSSAVADALAGVGEGANTIPWREADMVRRYLGNASGSNIANKADTRVATQALTAYDDMIRNLTPDDVDAGDIHALQEALPKARDLWTRMSRSQTIDDAVEASESYVGGTASGIRQQFGRILRNPKMARGFSEVEKRAMRRAVNGSIPQRLLNLAGGGLGQMATVGVGAHAGGPVGAIAGAGVAGVAQRGAEALSRRNAEIVRALVASGGMAEAPTMSPVARALLEGSLLGQAPQTANGLQELLRR